MTLTTHNPTHKTNAPLVIVLDAAVCICIKKQATTLDALQKGQEAILAVAGETLAQQYWAGLQV